VWSRSVDEGGRVSSASISATSKAKMSGGKPFLTHVMIVVDGTGSMGTSCSAGARS
jgi:hypothetical protein